MDVFHPSRRRLLSDNARVVELEDTILVESNESNMSIGQLEGDEVVRKLQDFMR
jgi:hypothetical protein